MSEHRRDTDASRFDTDETIDRLTIAEAAERLGLSVDAVRMRVRRGTLLSEDADGKKVVLVARSVADALRSNADATTTKHSGEQGEYRRDTNELVEHLRSEVTYLRQTLDAEIESRRRADHLVAGMIEERRGLMAQIAALTAGEGEREAEHRRGGDETGETAQDAPQDAHTAPPRDAGPRMTDTTLIEAREPHEPISDRLALGWRRWWRRVRGG